MLSLLLCSCYGKRVKKGHDPGRGRLHHSTISIAPHATKRCANQGGTKHRSPFLYVLGTWYPASCATAKTSSGDSPRNCCSNLDLEEYIFWTSALSLGWESLMLCPPSWAALVHPCVDVDLTRSFLPRQPHVVLMVSQIDLSPVLDRSIVPDSSVCTYRANLILQMILDL